MQDEKNADVAGIVATSTITRIVINTSRRFVYPFAPAISRGLGIPMSHVTSVIAVNQATSIFALFASHLADRKGYRIMMLSGLGLVVAGMLLAGAVPVYLSLLAGMFLCGLGKNVFDPAVQAYVSNRVPYSRRGLVIGIMEISWAGSTLIGIPLIGVLIGKAGWRSPFFLIAAAGVLCILLVLFTVKNDYKKGRGKQTKTGFTRRLKMLLKSRTALSAAGFGFFASLANDNLFVVYGAWLEQSFGLSVVAVGIGTGVIGLSELTGEIFTATLSDRIGLKRSVLTGLVLSFAVYGLIPFVAVSLLYALFSLFFLFLFFEFCFVSFLSVCTELFPKERATMMALFFIATGLGRMTGAFAGGILWKSSGIAGICLFSAVFNVLAFWAVWAGVNSK